MTRRPVCNNNIKSQPQLRKYCRRGWTKDHGSAIQITQIILKFQFNLPSMGVQYFHYLYTRNEKKNSQQWELTCLKLLYVTRSRLCSDIWRNYNDDEIILNKLDERFFFFPFRLVLPPSVLLHAICRKKMCSNECYVHIPKIVCASVTFSMPLSCHESIKITEQTSYVKNSPVNSPLRYGEPLNRNDLWRNPFCAIVCTKCSYHKVWTWRFSFSLCVEVDEMLRCVTFLL